MDMISNLNISIDRIEQHFAELSQIGNLGPSLEDGFLRAAWSNEETEAMEYVKRFGEDGGLLADYDGVGNLVLHTSGSQQEIVQIGSHLDTVPKGGMFDGSAGIIAGLEAILALRDSWGNLKRGLELVVWRGEESATFDAVFKGSRAAFGLNDPAILLNEFQGRTLQEAILSQGFDPGYIKDRRPTLSQQQIASIAAHLELHIEQADELERDKKDIGIATSIRGMIRLRVMVTGQAAHSGGTPMGISYRRDANLAIAYMQVELDQMASQVLGQGYDLVQTIGIVNSDKDYNTREPKVYENALTKVSPFGYFTVDIRSNHQRFFENYRVEAEKLIQKIAHKFGVDVSIEKITSFPVVKQPHPVLQDLIESSCRDLGVSYQRMPCGALHDVAVVSNQRRHDGSDISGALILIPCRDGISHNPNEYTTSEALQKGSMVLARTLYKLAA